MTHGYASPLVVKYGGNAMRDGGADPLLEEIAALRHAGRPVIVVHGGGPEIDRWLSARSIQSRRIDGMRVTDAATLETTEAVLCGTINKRIVRALSALGVPAAGVSGQDARTLVAKRSFGKEGVDLGFVGEIVECSPALLHALLSAGYLPVVAPLAVAADGSTAYNVNADLAAAAIASATKASAFMLMTNVRRVLRDPDDATSGIDRIDVAAARAFSQSDACRESMKPKIDAALAAAEAGVSNVYICAAGPEAIRRAFEGDATTIVAA